VAASALSRAASPLSSAAAAPGATFSEAVEAKAAPDSSSELKELQRLMQQSVSDTLPSADGEGRGYLSLESKSMSLPWDDDDEDDDDSPSWMIDSSEYKPQ
jgi:hypothetical protein